MTDTALKRAIERLAVVCVFCGDIVPTNEELRNVSYDGWRSGRAMEFDKTGPTWSYERILAAAEIWKINPEIKIILSGGKTTLEVPGADTAPTIARVAAYEPMTLGVDATSITEESSAYTSKQQLEYCDVLVRRYHQRKIAILAPCWQFARISATISRLNPITISLNTTFLSMERVLEAADPSWNEKFSGWYSTSPAREMFAKECLGAGQLWTGHQPRYPNPFRGFIDPLE